MGNWRRIRIQLTIPKNDIVDLKIFLKKYGVEYYFQEKTNDKLEILWSDNINFPNYKYGDSEDVLKNNEMIMPEKIQYTIF